MSLFFECVFVLRVCAGKHGALFFSSKPATIILNRDDWIGMAIGAISVWDPTPTRKWSSRRWRRKLAGITPITDNKHPWCLTMYTWCVQLPFLKPYRYIADSILSFLLLPILINIIDISMRKKILMYKKGNICLICRLFCACHRHIQTNAILFSSMYFVYLSLSFHRDTIYLFYIYTFFYLITVAVGARTCLGTLLPIFPFFLSSGWTEIGVIHMYIDSVISYLVVTMHLPLEASYRKITNERKREFLSTLGRMQALLVSYTACDSVTTISRNACRYSSLSCTITCSDKHSASNVIFDIFNQECRRIFGNYIPFFLEFHLY